MHETWQTRSVSTRTYRSLNATGFLILIKIGIQSAYQMIERDAEGIPGA